MKKTMQLPEEYKIRMRELLGDEYPAYVAAMDEPRLYGLRVNTSKTSAEEFERIAPFPIRRIPYVPNGFFYDGENVQPAKHPYYYAGLYYLQDPSAMTPASVLPVEPGDRVLDLCAAPGGKSTELAAKLHREESQGRNDSASEQLVSGAEGGVLVANDISVKRAKALLKNIELFGVTRSLITTEYPGRLAEVFPSFFDKILIDAPCSGEGMFRKDPAMIRAWEPDSPEKYAAMQEDIVRQALPMLAPGGALVYSTCTFSPLEDEATVMKILDMDPTLTLESVSREGFAEGRPDLVNGPDILKKCVRIFPHRMEGEGHFLALFRKSLQPLSGEGDEKKKSSENTKAKKKGKKSGKNRLSKEARLLWESFAADLACEWEEDRIEEHDGMLYYIMPEFLDVTGLKFLRNGLFLGSCKKNRFEPSQALAMALTKDSYTSILDMDRDDDRVVRYLKGETIRAEKEQIKDGLILICVDGYPLGWGKASAGTVKNKYHTGWRLM